MDDVEGVESRERENLRYAVCNARTRGEDAENARPKIEPGEWGGPGYCRRPAGWGTQFEGGRCKQHGGAAAWANLSHGLYSKSTPGDLAVRIEQLLERSEELEDSAYEVALMRALLEAAAARELGPDGVTAELAETFTRIADRVAKASARLHRRRHGDEVTLSIVQARTLVTRVVWIVREVVGVEAAAKVGARIGVEVSALRQGRDSRVLEAWHLSDEEDRNG